MIQRYQSVALRTIVAAYRYYEDDIVHGDLKILSVQNKKKPDSTMKMRED